eukprot:1139717-Prymnesium_polylepis.1
MASSALTHSFAAWVGEAQIVARLTVTAGGIRRLGTRQRLGCQSFASRVRYSCDGCGKRVHTPAASNVRTASKYSDWSSIPLSCTSPSWCITGHRK